MYQTRWLSFHTSSQTTAQPWMQLNSYTSSAKMKSQSTVAGLKNYAKMKIK